MGLPFAIVLTGMGLMLLVRQRPTDREDDATDGWWWLRFISWWMLVSGVALWLVWAVIQLLRWLM